ncbi:MAG TPA: FMN-binding protein [Candidatus Binatia bacterium]|nr:FMN-binding protein [Candidatus Binatia bacterium]
MKRALVVILAIAVLGILRLVSTHNGSTTSTDSSQSSATNVNTGSQTSSDSQSATSQSDAASAKYKDGTFAGSAEDTPYGTVKVAAVISGGKITDIKYLQMPNDEGHTQEVTAYAEPLLKQAAIKKQSPNIDFVSGATDTSFGFKASLQAALDAAASNT